MGLQFAGARAVSAVSTWGLKNVFRRPAANFPGKIALYVDPRLIADLAPKLEQGSVCVVGTNGKTTVTNLLADALELAAMKKYPYLVIEQDGKIEGYAYAHAFVGRAAYDWSSELTIYLDPNARKGGLGRRLYEELADRLKKMGILNLYACIGYPQVEDEYLTKNSAEFHAHLGFELVGTFHNCGYKFDRWYDMVWMEKIIGEPHAGQPAVKSYSEIKE